MGPQSSFDLMSPVTLSGVGALLVGVVLLYFIARWWIGPPMANARRRGLQVIRALILLTLLAILMNPVRVDRSSGTIERPKVVYLLDTSESMALGTGTTRFEQMARTTREVDRLLPADSRPTFTSYRFGEAFLAIESLEAGADGSAIAPTDRDTQLLAALRQLPSRFGPSRPRAVVLFSDGRARDREGLEEMARRYGQMNVPIHVVPAGDPVGGGDVAVVNMALPARVRKHSRVGARVWVRSYGYDGERTQLRLWALGDDTKRPLTQLPITLQSGIQSFNPIFQTDLQTMRIEATVPIRSDEVSIDNNAVTADVAVDRTKIRVLYIEGSTESLVQRIADGRRVITGPYSCLSDGLAEDPDIECMVLRALPGMRDLRPAIGGSAASRFPDTPAALFAFDAIVLSDVGPRALGDQELSWIEEWVNRRGGGLCMVGGPRSFAAGGWNGSQLEDLLPVVLDPTDNDWTSSGGLSVRPVISSAPHPIWNIVSDRRQNEAILRSFPDFDGANRFSAVKPGATEVAVTDSPQTPGGTRPVIVLGPYGKGRTMAVATGLTPRWVDGSSKNWGSGEIRYYAKFWRNVIYWLSENSVNGRRRLIATVDKISYRPGETIKLEATAYDEAANRTTDCRVTVIIEPQSLDEEFDSDYAPVGWPDEVQRTSGEEGPYVIWGEELEMSKRPGRPPEAGGYEVELPIADTSTGLSGTQALRIEISAYEDYALVDSTSLDVQILDDPFEHQNPLPDRALLRRIASLSGGEMLPDAPAVADALGKLRPKTGPPEVRKAPLWSNWWLLIPLLVLLAVEWAWRRSVGLA